MKFNLLALLLAFSILVLLSDTASAGRRRQQSRRQRSQRVSGRRQNDRGGKQQQQAAAPPASKQSQLDLARLQTAIGVNDALVSVKLVGRESNSGKLSDLVDDAEDALKDANTGVENIKKALQRNKRVRSSDKSRVKKGIDKAKIAIDGFAKAAGRDTDETLDLNIRNSRTAITNAKNGVAKIVDQMK